ncbi:MAG: antibiotic biosynthesis monooxygenase [Planctomycetia bacterium]|nr:antibiotic biosynthesis monooxygenase [Planctomycetia bacterium]
MRTAIGLLNRRNFCAASAVGIAAFGFNRVAGAAAAAADAPITQLAKFKLNMEKEEEGLQALKELCTAVEQNEPGVLAYVCSRSAKNPDELVFFEVYKDEDALKAHGKTAHLGKLRAAFATLFRGPLELTRLDRVGGFTR